jgi:N-carbamoylputrescine amidase
MALAGAEILIYPTAIGYETTDDKEEQARQRDAWLISQRAHAVANGLPVVSVNRTGFEADPSGVTKGIQFWGSSFVVGPQGEYLWQAPQDEEVATVVTIDRARTEDVRRIWPFFRDRRIDAYGGLTERYLD